MRTGTAPSLAMAILTISLSSVIASPEDHHEIAIENFDDPVHSWTTMNDPVMGGRSSSALEIDAGNGTASFDGVVAIVPFLHAPGFIQMMTSRSDSGAYPDVSSCTSLRMNLMALEEYSGYRVSFGTVHLPEGRHAYGYKADFDAPPVGEYGDVIVPFTEFTAKWNEGTGDAVVRCVDDSRYCPDEDALRDMRTMAVWGEGVEGTVRLRVKSIDAVGCGEGSTSASASSPTVVVEEEQEEEESAAAPVGEKASAHGKGPLSLSATGGFVALAALLSALLILKRARSSRESYAEVASSTTIEPGVV